MNDSESGYDVKFDPTTCTYCREVKAPAAKFWPTCGAKACQVAHRKERRKATASARYHALKEAGLCRCGKAPSRAPSKTTGQKVLLCPQCRRKINERARAKTAEAAKVRQRERAVARLAAATIERNRVQQARLDAGLPISLQAKPVLPKGTPRKRVDL